MHQKSTNLRMQKPCVLVSLLLLLIFPADGANSVRRLPGFPGELPFALETGYVGVGKFESIQIFYYFVESQRDPVNDPLILWLTGGPGCSGLSSLLYEIGPLMFNYSAFKGGLPQLISNPNTLAQVANILFLDAPVGTGFSYSKTDRHYYIKDDIDAADANYQFLQKWLLDHSKFLNNSLYIGGSSYSGKIVPILAHIIHTSQKTKQALKINLQGYILGNPATDEVVDKIMRIPYANRIGLISDDLYESAKVHCDEEYLYPDIKSALCLKYQQAIENCTRKIWIEHVLEPYCEYKIESVEEIAEALSGQKPWCRLYTYPLSEIWINEPGVREALHVQKGTADIWTRCNGTILGSYPTDAVSSVVDYHRSLYTSGYRALIYSGDHDMEIPYISTIKWIGSLNLSLSDPWRPWFGDNQVEGYTSTFNYKDSYELTFATIKGAGHIAPEYKPKSCFQMFSRWLSHSKL